MVFMAINMFLVRKSYVLFGMRMTKCRVYRPKSIMLILPALGYEIWISVGILYYVLCAGFTPTNLDRQHVSDSKLHIKMMQSDCWVYEDIAAE